MPESVPGAPAAAPAQSTPANGKAPNAVQKPQPAPAPKGPAAKAAPAPAPTEQPETPADDSWDEAKDRGELERYLKKLSKHDSKARVRVRGEEKGIESLDDFYSIINDAQRGRGAHKAIEEKNKEVAEARKVLELKQRAAEGDFEALQELAGPNAFERLEQVRQRSQEEQQLRAQMSDTERMLFDRLQQTEQLLQQREAMDKQQKAEKEKAAHHQRIEAAKGEAQQMAGTILEGLKLPPEKLAVIGPFMARKMREAAELGLQLGKDVPPEKILEDARGEMRAVLHESVQGLSPDQFADFIDELTPGMLQKVMKVYVGRLRGQKQQAQQPQQGNGQKQQAPNSIFGTPAYFRR